MKEAATRRSFLFGAGILGAIGVFAIACGQGETIVVPGKMRKTTPVDPTDDDEHVEGDPQETPPPVKTEPGKPEWTTKAKQLVGQNQGGRAYTTEAPGPFAGKERSHVPKMNVDAGVGLIIVNHVMETGGSTPEAGTSGAAGDGGDASAEAAAPAATHWVTTIWVEDDQGRVLALREYKATESAPPAFAFKVPEGISKVRAFEHCNLHGVWASDEVTLS